MSGDKDIRVGIIYPWTGLPAPDRGAARRIMPLVAMLDAHFRSVTTLSPGSGPSIKEGNITHLFHRPLPWEQMLADTAFRIFDGATHHAFRGRVPIRERRQWWHYLQPIFQPSLGRRIRELARSHDILLLEYPFWSGLLKDCGPVILTLLDILSEVVTSSPWLKRHIFRLELAACRRSATVVCVSEHDRDVLRAEGIEAQCIPHGFDLSAIEQKFPEEAANGDLERIETHREKGGLVCLFVGSSLQPNRDAVEAIKIMADRTKDEPGILFAVAGACCGPGAVTGNMISFGTVSESTLGRLYAASEVVLAPVTSGSGSSTKILEAFARGKALVSTAFGVRGYPITSGEEAIICDTLDDYPALLRRLFTDSAERERLILRGRKFVERYDCRVVYQPYLEMIRRLHNSRGSSS